MDPTGYAACIVSRADFFLGSSVASLGKGAQPLPEPQPEPEPEPAAVSGSTGDLLDRLDSHLLPEGAGGEAASAVQVAQAARRTSLEKQQQAAASDRGGWRVESARLWRTDTPAAGRGLPHRFGYFVYACHTGGGGSAELSLSLAAPEEEEGAAGSAPWEWEEVSARQGGSCSFELVRVEEVVPAPVEFPAAKLVNPW